MIMITESMRKQQWLCVLCFAFHAGITTGTCPENEYIAMNTDAGIVSTDDHSMDKSDTAANDCATESKACRLTGSMPFPFSTTGVTMVMKIRMTGTKSDWERVFALGQNQPTAYTTGDINVFRLAGNQQLKFNVYLINSCHVDHAYTFTQNEDLTVWIRYNPSTQQMQISVNSQVQTTSGCTMPSLNINQFVAGADHDYGSRSNMDMAGFKAFGRFLTQTEIQAVADSISFGTDDGVNVCLSCPFGMTSPAGSTSLDACVCAANTYAKPGDAVVEFNPADETFDGTNTGYDLGTTTLNIATAGFTVVARVKFAAFQFWSSIFDFSDSNGDTANNNIRVNNVGSTGKWSFDIREGGTVACQIYNQGTIELNTWYNIIARYKPGEGISLQANDAVYTLACTTITNRVSTRTYIGQSYHSGLANFKGSIAGLIAYNRYLSDDEAQAVLSTITNTLTLHTDTGSHSWTEAETYAASQGGRLPTLDELSAYETKTGYFAARNVNEWIPVTNPGAPSGADYMMAYNGHGFSIGDSRWDKVPSEGDPISSTFGQQEWVGVGQYPVWFSSDFACLSCPSGLTSPVGSTSSDACVCTANTYFFTIPDIEWQYRGSDSWGSLQQHEFVQAGVDLGYQSRYLTKEEITAWMAANGNSLPSTYQSWVWVSPGQSKTYGFWSIWTNAFHPYAPYEHDGTFGGSWDVGDGYFFRKNQPGTMCNTCSAGKVTSGDGAVSVDACICAANSYATSDEDMLTYTDSNFYVSSGQGLDQNTVYYETTNNGFALEFHHWDEKTFLANGYALFSYDGVYNTKTHNLAEVRVKNLVPGAEYKINLFHYLQTGWQHVGHHQGEFMFSVNGGSLQRFDTLEMPSSGVPPPTTSLTVTAKDDGTISLLFTRDMAKDAGGRFTSQCSVFDPPLRNCNAAGRHLVLSGLSIAPVCTMCATGTSSVPGSTSIDDCISPCIEGTSIAYWSIRKSTCP